MEPIGVEGAKRSRTEPQIVIDAVGRHAVPFAADRLAAMDRPGFRQVNGPQPPAADEIDGRLKVAAAALLQARLDHAAVPPGGGHHLLAFPDVVRDRFFDVNVFSRLARQNGHRRVPMVGRGDHDGIDGSIVEDSAEVGLPAGRLALHVRSRTGRRRTQAFVDVAQCHDIDVGHRRQVRGQRLTLVPHADGRHADALAGGRLGPLRRRPRVAPASPTIPAATPAAFLALEPKNCRRLTSCLRKSSTFMRTVLAQPSQRGPQHHSATVFYHRRADRRNAANI